MSLGLLMILDISSGDSPFFAKIDLESLKELPGCIPLCMSSETLRRVRAEDSPPAVQAEYGMPSTPTPESVKCLKYSR